MAEIIWRGKNREKTREEKAIDGEISFIEYIRSDKNY